MENLLLLNQWIEMLPTKPLPAKEKVVWVTKFAPSLKIRSDIWRHFFKGYQGCTLIPGSTLRIVNTVTNNRTLSLPSWAMEQLRLMPGDLVCISRKDKCLYLKRFDAVHIDCSIPGFIAYDDFTDTSVIRRWSASSSSREITVEHARSIIEQVGPLQVDPVKRLCALNERTGYLARKNLCGTLTDQDHQYVTSYCQSILTKQRDDGSWDGNALETAFNIMDLLEMGSTQNEDGIQRAVEWLLHLPEPTGAPGAFNANQEITELFNKFKSEHPQGRVSAYDKIARDRHRRAEFMPYIAHGDVFGIPNEFCDARHLFVTGIVLQALLQCGLAHNPRVNRALVTLMGRPWCQEYYHDDSNEVASTEPIDLNNVAYQVFVEAKFDKWELSEADVIKLTSATGLHKGKNYVTRSYGCGCPMMVSRALSYHPQWPGSHVQLQTTDGFVGRLGWDWSHMHAYPSFIFSYLARLAMPVAAYGAARYYPMLKNTQQSNGFWDESDRLSPISGRRKHVKFTKEGFIPPITREQSAYLICLSLKQLGLLSFIRP